MLRTAAVCLVLGLMGCASASPVSDNGVRVSGLGAPAFVRAGDVYAVTFRGVEKAPGIVLKDACFTWHAANWSDGPYCWKLTEDPQNGTVEVRLRTKNPNHYQLSAYLRYTQGQETKQSRIVWTSITVH